MKKELFLRTVNNLFFSIFDFDDLAGKLIQNKENKSHNSSNK
jgi:hypothetical protein